jgi:hypothetical protein
MLDRYDVTAYGLDLVSGAKERREEQELLPGMMRQSWKE